MNKFILAVTRLLFAGIANAEVPQLVPVNISDPILEKYNIRAKAAAGKESAYRIPEGSFYFGRNDDVWKLEGAVALPPYSTVTWTYDGDEAVSYKWEYPDMSKYNRNPNDFVFIESTERDLTYETRSYNFGSTPKVTATFEDGTSHTYFVTHNNTETVSYVQVGGHSADFYYQNMPGLHFVNSFGFSPYSFKYGTVVLNTDFSQKSYVFGNGEEITDEGCTGLACIMPQPGAPYIIDGGVRGLLFFNLQDEAEITVTLRKATKVSNEEYTLGAEIGHATLTGAQFKAQGRLVEGETYLGDILFSKLYKTDEDGNEVEVVPVVDSAIAIVFTGWDSSYVTKFAAFSNEQIYTKGKYDEKANARIGTYAMWTGGTYGNTAKAKYINIAPAITLHAYFPFVYCEESELLLDAKKHITTLEVDQYNYFAGLKILCDGVETSATKDSGETAINDWIKVNYLKDTSAPQFSNKIDLIVEENTGEERSAVISFVDVDGTKCDVVVKQAGVTGAIGSVGVDTTSVEYYNLQGVRVENPVKGVYIVKRGNTISKEIIK